MITRRHGAFTTLVVAALSLQVHSGRAQTVYSTFVEPGDGYNGTTQGIYFLGGSGNWLASSFLYSGSGALLNVIRFAAQDQYNQQVNGQVSPLTVYFKSGSSIATATTLESWTVPADPTETDKIYSLSSLIHPALVTNTRYWVELAVNGYIWGWNYNNQNPLALGNSSSSDGGVTWSDHPVNAAPVFDVSVTTAGSINAVTAPEPGTMSLLGLGLVGLAGATRRGKRK